MKYKKLSLFFISFLFISLCSWLFAKHAFEFYASQKANKLIEEAYLQHKPETIDEKIIAITTLVHKNFNSSEPSENLALRIRPILTNSRLPTFLRWKDGVIETIENEGQCDNAARKLIFILNKENFEAHQWNMVTLYGGHSAAIVHLTDDRVVLVDPFFGIISLNAKNQLRSPNEIYNFLHNGNTIEKTFTKISKDSSLKFYKDFKSVVMAKQGEKLTMQFTIPDFVEKLVLGELDNDFVDVMRDGRNHHINRYWHYMGHKYDRNWVRILKTQKPTKITFTLIKKPNSSVITANKEPIIKGNSLTWSLNAGDKLIFHDEKAKTSLMRGNSFIHVDQITFSEIKS